MAKRLIKKKQSSKENNNVNIGKITRLVKELSTIKENKKLLAKREEILKAELSEYVDNNGAKDSKGSRAVILEVDGVKKLMKREKRESISLNQAKAKEVLEELGLWEELSVEEVKRVANEGYIEQALLNNEITEDDVDKMIDSKVSFAFILKDYKENEEEY